ncbi:hypothetical protein LL250_17555, partial [Halomonas meridiana]|nr:hypothetical protein [Halomonas meridiana]
HQHRGGVKNPRLSSSINLKSDRLLAAKVGGAPVRTAALRVLFWGALAMALTSLIGRLFGVMA